MNGSLVRAATWLAAFSALALVPVAGAQTYPARPVRIIVPFPPGGGVDTLARFLAQKFTEQIGGSFIVENRPGGAGILGAELAARAAPDGHTLFTSAPEFSINPSVRLKLPYDPLKDFVGISQLTSGQFMVASHPSVPARTVIQLIALARAQPDRLTYGTSGAGSINHLAGELFRSMAGFRWTHVPFKGTGPATSALMGGEIDFVFAGTITLAGLARAGKVRPVAVTGPKRFAELPDLPTISESGVPGYNVTGWYGFYAPAGTPADLVRRLHVEAVHALNSPDVKERLVKTGNEPVATSPAEFAAFLRAEISKWAKLVKAVNLRID